MKVSICCITYNHEKFVAQTIESVLMQKTNFPFELIISEDLSTDNTRKICEEYAAKHPDIVKLLPADKKYGAIPNFARTLVAGSGEYVAICEGDDYWTDPHKLQKQVEILDQYNDVAISAHNTVKLVSTGQTYLYTTDKRHVSPGARNIFTIEDYITRAFFHTSSIMFRRTALKEFPAWYKDVFGGDYFLVLLLTMNGKIHFVNENRSVYRINSQSVSHFFTRIEILENYLKHLTLFDEYSGYKYHDCIEGMKFSYEFGRYYYYPSYFTKVKYAFKNMAKIFRIHPSVISKWGRWKIFIPTVFLRSKVNLFAKNKN